MEIVIIAIIAYLIGSVNFSVLISKKMAGFDVREKGSGNGGTTNVLRTVGKKAALLTLLADILKGVVAILIAYLVRKICKNESSTIGSSGSNWCCCGTHISRVFWISRGKRNCDKFGNFVIVKLGNWLNLLDFCTFFDGSYKNGFLRFDFSGSFVSDFDDIYSRTLFS